MLMVETEIRRIQVVDSINAKIQLPPSKSYTNRALIAAALADGSSTIQNPSCGDDSQYLIQALRDLGIIIDEQPSCLMIEGTNGIIRPSSKELFIGNAGTAMRFLTSLAALVRGETVLTGDDQMLKRPINDLLDAIRAAGIRCESANGFPPVKIHGGNFVGGYINMKASISSQFVSSILLAAPYANHTVNLHMVGKVSSMPYIDMTLHVMREFGGQVDFIAPSTYIIHNTERYIGHTQTIESDASSATYFGAAAAITGGHVEFSNLSTDSLQGDIRFLEILAQMGCRVSERDGTVSVQGGDLIGIEIDMNDLPDCVPTLAIAAMFARGSTTITNIGHLKFKESDRLKALSVEMAKLGAKIELSDDSITIHPRSLHGATIETYNDHRMAMSFAVAGLRVPGVIINNPNCVTKSFPNFWEEFQKLESKAS
jgi:3-phosphoshikimate 1-carboxyvinyltransferase